MNENEKQIPIDVKEIEEWVNQPFLAVFTYFRDYLES